MRLLGRTSSINVRKVLWTLEEIGAPFTHEAQWGTPAGSLSSPDYLKLNPNGLIPVLVDDDCVLWESNTICRYLAGKAGRGDLLPTEPGARAQVEMWMDWQATELNGTWGPAYRGLVKDRQNADAQQIARSTEAWNSAMSLLDAQLRKTGAYAAGHAFTLADIVIGLSAHRWRQTPLHHAALPCVEDYLARLDKRAAFRKWATPDLP